MGIDPSRDAAGFAGVAVLVYTVRRSDADRPVPFRVELIPVTAALPAGRPPAGRKPYGD